jgi:hypothetical protein
MATVREGNKAALVVVDVQVGVMREVGMLHELSETSLALWSVLALKTFQ